MRGQGNEPPVLRSKVQQAKTSKQAREGHWDSYQVGWGTQYQMSIIETSSEGHSPLSLSLNTKSKLQTCGYETAGGSEVEGGEWVASHSGGGKKQRLDPTTTSE